MRILARMHRRLRVGLARDWEFRPGRNHRGDGVDNVDRVDYVLVIAPRNIPTIDYYLGDVLSDVRRLPCKTLFDVDIERWLDGNFLESIPVGTRVILVRMPDSRWARVLEAASDKLQEVIWLIDDDVFAAREDTWLPEDYRLRLLADYLRFKRAFEPIIDRIWASTAFVASRFPADLVEVRPPRPIAKAPSKRLVTLFYHGTGAHRREHAFLLPILQEVQSRLDYTVVEVTGDYQLYRMFSSVPRLRVLHPMAWPDYLVHLRSGRYDIGLVPLLDTPFNRARSGVKALEIASIGATGLLSRRLPYLEYAHLPGMHLVGDDAQEGVNRIVELGAGCSAAR